MHSTILSTVALVACATLGAAVNINVTPHDMYSSSIGVLGCKIDTNRVAYWPEALDCNNICVKVSYGGRSVNLLRIDQSGGAHDISYDAWNYLYTGYSARDRPTAGGGVGMTYENRPADECRSLIKEASGKLAFSGANSMNFIGSCLNQPGSWVARNYVLYNILNPTCTYGYDETCTLNWPSQNQATCPHQLGVPAVLTSQPVYNIQYPTGQLVKAL